MNQRGQRAFFISSLIFFLVAGGGACDRHPSPQPARSARPTVACLVPAATDLIVAMGAGDHLAAVSDYDRQPEVAGLPRVGAYQSIDWEKLAAIRPDVIVTQYDQSQMPAGFAEKAKGIGANQVNLKIERLADIYSALTKLGDACGEPAKAAAQATRIQRQIEWVHQQVAREPPVRTLIVRTVSGRDLVGRETFLDDLLTQAGGENATAAPRYPTVDTEAVAAARPAAILQLLPDADDRTLKQAAALWDSLPQLPAVKQRRVWQLKETFIEQPGSHVAETAEIFARKLHPQAMATPSSQPSPP